jgi:hypothetical protein
LSDYENLSLEILESLRRPTSEVGERAFGGKLA